MTRLEHVYMKSLEHVYMKSLEHDYMTRFGHVYMIKPEYDSNMLVLSKKCLHPASLA